MKALIITGGSIDYDWAEEFLSDKSYDYVVAADRGLNHADRLGVRPHAILGDYDSVLDGLLEKYCDTDITTFPRQKDFTDTHLAIINALKAGADDITILGGIGTRLDHTMTNIGCMKAALDAGVQCHMYDKHNKIYLAGDEQGVVQISKDAQYGKYVSLVPMTESAVVSLEGFLYRLDRYDLKQGLSVCQSNEISDDISFIKVHKGLLIVFETKD